MLSLAFAPDGKSLACGIGKEVRLYDLSAETAGRVVARHDADVTSVAFTPDGAGVISGSHDQTAQRTNVATGALEWRAPGSYEQVNSVALSNDGSLLVTGSSDHRFARGRAPARATGPGAVRLWDARTGRMLRRLGEPAEQVMAVAVSPDGRRIAGGGGTQGGSGAVHIWDAATGAAVWSSNDHVREVLAVAFSPDGARVAVGDARGVVKVYDARDGHVAQTFTDHNGGATALAFSPDGMVLFCAEAFGGTRAWELATGRLTHAFKARGPEAEAFTIDRLLQSIGLSRDGNVLATCASSVNSEFVDAVRLWDARTGTLQRDFALENIHGRPMALSPDGAVIATGGKSVKLWDARTGTLLRELFGHLKRTQSIVFSADGRLVIAGGSYGTTNIWEAATGRHLVTLFTFVDARTGALTDDWLAYHPDGYYDGSPGVERYLGWRVGEEFQTPATLGQQLHRPERIAEALKLAAP
jgi:YD repeat-containing protein